MSADTKYSITPCGEAYVELTIAKPRATSAEVFSAGWDARQAEIDEIRRDLARTQARLAAVERERDEWGGKAASFAEEARAFRCQRDEAQQALAQLTGRMS